MNLQRLTQRWCTAPARPATMRHALRVIMQVMLTMLSVALASAQGSGSSSGSGGQGSQSSASAPPIAPLTIRGGGKSDPIDFYLATFGSVPYGHALKCARPLQQACVFFEVHAQQVARARLVLVSRLFRVQNACTPLIEHLRAPGGLRDALLQRCQSFLGTQQFRAPELDRQCLAQRNTSWRS